MPLPSEPTAVQKVSSAPTIFFLYIFVFLGSYADLLDLLLFLIAVALRKRVNLGIFSTDSCSRGSLVCYRACLGSLQAADSTLTRSSYAEPR
ncbi:hypothetical protein EI94DRAFT_1754775 [Lactarius quietus]|nr:hypothetical protein EI94DRAFT_1754775 [Lactarius quietus]